MQTQAAVQNEASAPAFPASLSSTDGHQDGHNTWQFPGLSKRELFAAMAMQGLTADPGRNGNYADYSRDAVKFADALLAELAKGGAA